MFFLIRSKILCLFDNTLAANYEYFQSILQNLHLPIEIKLSEKPSKFPALFFPYLGFKLNLPCSEKKKKKKRTLIGKYFWSYFVRKMCLFKCVAKLLSENDLAVKELTILKNSWNVQKSTFLLVFHHSEPNWARKSYF